MKMARGARSRRRRRWQSTVCCRIRGGEGHVHVARSYCAPAYPSPLVPGHRAAGPAIHSSRTSVRGLPRSHVGDYLTSRDLWWVREQGGYVLIDPVGCTLIGLGGASSI